MAVFDRRPKRFSEGDRIEEMVDGETQSYEVMAPGAEPVFQTVSAGTTLRIHTKRVS